MVLLLARLVRLAGTADLRGDVVLAADVQRDRLVVSGIFRAESLARVMAIALVPIALAGRAGYFPAAVIFIVAMRVFVVASRLDRRLNKP